MYSVLPSRVGLHSLRRFSTMNLSVPRRFSTSAIVSASSSSSSSSLLAATSILPCAVHSNLSVSAAIPVSNNQRRWISTENRLRSAVSDNPHSGAATSSTSTSSSNAPTSSKPTDIHYLANSEGDIEWTSNSTRPRIVVLGTGWGSVAFLKGLDINKYEVVVISPRNYFLFTPLLPSACTGTIDIGSLTEPIRQILLSRHATSQQQYVEAKALGLDRAKRKLSCRDLNGRDFVIGYDHLLVGVGSKNNTFNTPGVDEHAFFLKEANHARLIRKEILERFERASSPTTSLKEKESLLQFVVVGGGPTGVEFAGELVDFLHTDLVKQFPQLVPHVRVRLIQSQDHILNTYDAAISHYAEKKFKELHIEIIANALVTGMTKDTITYKDLATKQPTTISYSMCLWSTGIEMNEFTRSISRNIRGQESEKALVTDEYLRLLQEIPELDRVPSRIVQEATKVLETKAASPNSASNSASSDPDALPFIDDMPRLLNVDPRVYAYGDCATTYIPKLSKRMKSIFKAADTNKNGKLGYDELKALCTTLSTNFPVMGPACWSMLSAYEEQKDPMKNDEIDFAQFEKLLLTADRNARVYPATAQVASQQGAYLAKRFNIFAKEQVRRGVMKDAKDEDDESLEHRLVKPSSEQQKRQTHPAVAHSGASNDSTLKPFRYRHMGSLAYIGGETAAIDLGKGGLTYTGTTAFWLWKSIYLSKSVSTRTRINLAFDWCRTWFFGRDTSKP